MGHSLLYLSGMGIQNSKIHHSTTHSTSAHSKAVLGDAQQSVIELAKEVMLIEARAIEALSQRLDANFTHAVNHILQCQGKVVVSGMGKSGHIANKIAATLASTGTPAFFMHAAEASHGDLGMLDKSDVMIALSYSGESEELLSILPMIKRLNIKMIGITGNEASTLARASDVHLNVFVAKEACPLGLAPTASTTTCLALGDALALAVLDRRGFSAEDFARSHPSGSLGRKLLLRISDVMRQEKAIPAVNINASFKEGLLEMTRKGLGMTAIVDAENVPVGIFTDGDLRRTFEQGLDLEKTKIQAVMHENPLHIAPDQLAVDAVALMESKKISALLVVDTDGKLVGALNMHDLLMAKVV